MKNRHLRNQLRSYQDALEVFQLVMSIDTHSFQSEFILHLRTHKNYSRCKLPGFYFSKCLLVLLNIGRIKCGTR